MLRRTIYTSLIMLFLLALGASLLPPEVQSACRLQLYAWWSGVPPLAPAPAGPPPSLERARATDDPAARATDLERQVRELGELLLIRTAELEDARRHLQQLSEAFEFVPGLDVLQLTPARVLYRTGRWPAPDPGTALVLDRGRADGVHAGDVLIQGQSVIGQIVQASPHRARGTLITHPATIIAARLARPAHADCYLRGTAAGACEVVFMGRPPPATAGDLVLTSGLLDTYPPDLILGELSAAPQESEDRHTHVAPLTPRADLAALDALLIVHRPGRTGAPRPPAAP